ncbi:kinase-like protein, partial [Fistulina hepatica ATCC 64428]
SVGVVYKGHDVKTGEAVAIKLEPRGDIKKRFLEYEAQQMRNLRTPFTPEFKAFGCEHSYWYMVVELLGPSLHMLRQRSPTFTFDKETVVLLAIQLLFAIEYIHGMNVVHQDIKADNIVLRSDQPNLINIIDFGVCGPFKDHLGRHLPSRPSLFFPGTAEFSSVKAHRDLAQTRQDDLESIVYTLVDLATHDLPWCVPGLSFRRIAEVKATTSPEQICAGLPPEFAHMLTYARRLEYSARPDYSGLRAAF